MSRRTERAADDAERGFDRRSFLRHGLRLGAAAAAAGPVARWLDDLPLGSSDLTDALAVAASAPAPALVRRSQWGADESLRRAPPAFAPVRKFVVHHTVTPNADPDPFARVRAIYRYHTLTNGWSDIGYNFLVDAQGRVYEGRLSGGPVPGEDRRGRGVIGAHAAGYNTGSIGIALLGSFVGAAPSAAAVEALVRLIAWKAERVGVDPRGADVFTNANGVTSAFPNVTGHGTVGRTSCPGVHLAGVLPSVAGAAALRIGRGFIGYRMLAADGAVTHHGGASNGGDLRVRGVPAGGIDIAGAPNGQGYWVLDRIGGVHTFEGAGYHGSIPEMRLRGQRVGDVPPAGIEATPTGLGYWIVDAIGGVFTFGDARFHGSLPALRLAGERIGAAIVVDLATTPSGRGYWLVDDQGGVFAFGDARFFGSVPGLRARGNRIGPSVAVSMASTPSGRGYWILDSAGGVFTFGDAGFHGSLPQRGVAGAGRAVGIVPSVSGRGYLVASEDGSVHTFGDAPFYGRPTGGPMVAVAPVRRR